MNLPQANLHPPFNITRASHLVLTSRDLAKARDFYTEVIGLKVSDETATTIHLRGVEERAHHSLTLKKTKELSIGQHQNQNSGLQQSVIDKGADALSRLAGMVINQISYLFLQ